MRRRWVLAAALLLLAAAGHAALDAWIDRTVLPRIASETSVEIRDQNGDLLRAYQVESGIWRLAPRPGAVDPGFIAMLLRCEDKRFHRHNGVEPVALLRAAGQALLNGRALSGGSTLTCRSRGCLKMAPPDAGPESFDRCGWRWPWSAAWTRTRSWRFTSAMRPMAETLKASAPRR
jgi:hypothetical protein